MTTSLISILLVLLASLIGAFGSLFFKQASAKLHRNPLTQIRNYRLFFGVIAYGISTIIFLFALRGGELSVLYPFVATVYVWASILSVKFLGETMNTTKWIGVGLILLGVTAIGLGS